MARVATKSYMSTPIHYSIGVFQGCTISPILFNVTIQLLLDLINQPKFQPLAYSLHTPNAISLLSSAYADDIQITTSKPEYNQKLLNSIDEFLCWSKTMRAKPSKCYTLAMKRFDARYPNMHHTPLTNKSYSHYNPNLHLSGECINVITDEGFKYLGVLVEPLLKEHHSRDIIKTTLLKFVNLVNDTHIANTAKLWMYNHHIVPRLSWWFTTRDLSLSFVYHLHSMVLPFLKRWCGLPRSSILFCGSKSRPGLRLKRIPTVLKQSRATQLQLLKYSRDNRLRMIYEMKLKLEESRLPGNRKYAPSIELECAEACRPPSETQRPTTAGLGFRQPFSTKCDDSSRSHVAKYIHGIDVSQQLNHLSTLQMQGCWTQWDGLMGVDFNLFMVHQMGYCDSYSTPLPILYQPQTISDVGV